MGKTIALVCAHNEEKFLSPVLRSLKNALKQGVIDGFVVVNDGSTDRTSGLAREAGAQVVDLKKNMGKSFAFYAGVRHVKQNNPDCEFLVCLDADLEKFEPTEINKMVSHLRQRRYCNMVVGRRINDVYYNLGGERAFRFKALVPLANRAPKWVELLNLNSSKKGKEKLGEILRSGFGLEIVLNHELAKKGFELVPTDFLVLRDQLRGPNGRLVRAGLDRTANRIRERYESIVRRWRKSRDRANRPK